MKIEDIRYPESVRLGSGAHQDVFANPFGALAHDLTLFARLASEFGADGVADEALNEAILAMKRAIQKCERAAESAAPNADEPETLPEIRRLRPKGPRRLCERLPEDYEDRFLGAFLGRGAGCTLGAALEFRSVEEMEEWARYIGQPYPPRDYWKMVKNPYKKYYLSGYAQERTREFMRSIPADDDTGYTLIGLMLLEAYGERFTHEDMARLWQREYMPITDAEGSNSCYWGERNMLENLEKGLPVSEAGRRGNPYAQSVAAWTRADNWGYAAAGWPEKAAELAFKDASINHRRNGVYGEMFFAAAIAAAFCVDDPVEALRIGLTEIPENCLFADGIRWALSSAGQIRDYKEAASAVRARYNGMFGGHAVATAVFVALGVQIGGRDFTRAIGETVAMGYDNDCTGATAGSIVGAVIGKSRLPPHWYEPFQNRMRCYFHSAPEYLCVDELFRRYEAQAKRLREGM